MEDDDRDLADEIAEQWSRVDPALPVDAIGVVARILRIAKVFTDHRRRTLASLGVDSATFDLLATLRRSGPPYRMTPLELVEACLVTGGAISQRVARAEAAGLVTAARTVGGHTVTVELTARGTERIDGDIGAFLTAERALIDHLRPDELDELTRLLRRLQAGLPL